VLTVAHLVVGRYMGDGRDETQYSALLSDLDARQFTRAGFDTLAVKGTRSVRYMYCDLGADA
jgi:hypothetical protein